MSDLALPEPVALVLQAVEQNDSEAFLALFSDGAAVDDWGIRHVGAVAIRLWNDCEFIGARGKLVPLASEQSDNVCVMTANWTSTYHSGRSRYVFVMDGAHIAEMRITRA